TDVLIGGQDGDTIYGGSGDDLLLGNDIDTSDEALLVALARDWFLADSSSAAATAAQFASLAIADDSADSLHGETGADWYLMYLSDRLKVSSEGKGENTVQSFNTP